MECISKIGNLDISICIGEDVIAFKISVDLPPSVYNLKSPQNLPDDIGNNTLIDILLEMRNKVIEGAIVHVLYKHKEGILVVVGEVMFDDVLGLAEIHDSYFLFDPL